jgi:hypothetical protein
MRSATAILTAAILLTAAPTEAQTYDPDYPVCLQLYGIAGGYIACGYDSIAQCAQSASGRAAQCIINPYFAGRDHAKYPGPGLRQRVKREHSAF